MNTLKSGFRGGKIVRRLDAFPELEKALRNGDLLTGRLFVLSYSISMSGEVCLRQQAGRLEQLE